MDAWKFYDLSEPVKPTIYELADAKSYRDHMDTLGVERALVLPNYGIPVQSQPSNPSRSHSTSWSWSRRLRTTGSVGGFGFSFAK